MPKPGHPLLEKFVGETRISDLHVLTRTSTPKLTHPLLEYLQEKQESRIDMSTQALKALADHPTSIAER